MKFRLGIVTLITTVLISISMTVKVSASRLGTSNFKNLSIKDGLSSNNITTIFQDSKGYMWIGTSDGLNRYDEEYFKTYNCDINNENSLSSTYITALKEDSYGNIWIGTDNGLDILDVNTDEVFRFRDKELEKYNLGGIKITSLLHSNYEDNTM